MLQNICMKIMFKAFVHIILEFTPPLKGWRQHWITTLLLYLDMTLYVDIMLYLGMILYLGHSGEVLPNRLGGSEEHY